MTKVDQLKLKFYIVIPAHNEEPFIGQTLQSLINQTYRPEKIVVVNDHSTDNTATIVEKFAQKYSFISLVNNYSSEKHLPGAKVVRAFYKGLETLDDNWDILCKFDADLIFPKNYLSDLRGGFQKNPRLGVAGGFCQIKVDSQWELEELTNKEHLRGALKAYRKPCFEAIGQLKTAMGWDTVDELLAIYNGWEVKTFKNLQVKHLRPTGQTYQNKGTSKQGEAFYRLRYGVAITLIASAKSAWRKKSFLVFSQSLNGYFRAKRQGIDYLVNKEEGRWIRDYRREKMKQKIWNRICLQRVFVNL